MKHYVVIEPDIENAKIKARIDNSISDKNLRIERENLIEMRNKWQNQI